MDVNPYKKKNTTLMPDTKPKVKHYCFKNVIFRIQNSCNDTGSYCKIPRYQEAQIANPN